MRIPSNLSPRRTGDLGEAAARFWLELQGARVWIPLSHSPFVDLIAETDHELLRVQVKASTQRTATGRFPVTVCTRGGNQSWDGVTRHLDPARIDYLFLLIADGRRWFIPAGAVGARTAITVGGPKYSEFEVDDEPGFFGATIPSALPRGDS
ncbi:MAG: group I intron-associated PD-(D/E)XK endonuclease [Solirubrobacteraceae bacterium]